MRPTANGASLDLIPSNYQTFARLKISMRPAPPFARRQLHGRPGYLPSGSSIWNGYVVISTSASVRSISITLAST
jgi:hypothetical protein